MRDEMKLGFLYAGQGSQKVGMGKDFYQEFPSFRALYDQISLDFDVKQLSFEGPEEQLSQTKYTQPCMVAFAVGVTDLLKEEGIVPSAAAGLSLGEYSALYAAGALDAQTVIPLVAYRGLVMEETTQDIPSKMVAILGGTEQTVQQAVEKGQQVGAVGMANLNCPGQIVIGGEAPAVDAAAEFAKELGVKRCVPLNVSGPFHTSLMAEASELLGQKLKEVNISKPSFSILCNVTGEELAPRPDKIRQNLTLQVKSPVRFQKTIETLDQMGIDTIVEIGPGKVLSGFVKKTAPHISCINIEDVAGFNQAVTLLKGGSME
jgi:[acyl-carrier-protein] S-malonyltransferase